MNWEAFRAYDIRGVYPTDLNEEAYYEIGRGYVHIFRPSIVAVGMDARLSSPPLKQAIVRGLRDSGVDVVDIGEATTDMLYFAVGAYGYSGGVIVSASHNPAEYNGIKMIREKATAISSDTGLFDIRDALKQGLPKSDAPPRMGGYSRKEILSDYVRHVLSFIDESRIRPITFVGNGNFGYVCGPVREIVRRLGVQMLPLNFEPDGSFPKGPPDPMRPANRAETVDLVRKSGAAFAAMWDADADRVMFLDEKGNFISGAYVNALLAKIMLRKHGAGQKVIFDPRVIWPIKKVIGEMEGIPVLNKGGHAFMKDRMRAENALYAGELSAHYYFRDNFYADNGIIPFLLVLEELSRIETSFSELVQPFTDGHYLSGELNYRAQDVKGILEKVQERYRDRGSEDFTDGYSLEAEDWRFNIRGSNTEPLLRLNIEALRPELVDELRKDLETVILA